MTASLREARQAGARYPRRVDHVLRADQRCGITLLTKVAHRVHELEASVSDVVVVVAGVDARFPGNRALTGDVSGRQVDALFDRSQPPNASESTSCLEWKTPMITTRSGSRR